MFELCYTSLPRGLEPGTTGYSTVGRTKGVSKGWADVVASFNRYEPVVANPTAYASNPVNFSHVIKGTPDRRLHVVSRIGACEPDHSGRSNFLAHHMLFSSEEVVGCPAGPAAVAGSGMLMAQWKGEARELEPRPVPRLPASGPSTDAIAAAGLAPEWGQALADRLRDPASKTWLIYPQQMDILGVVTDALSHLAPADRWRATFATYATRQFPPSGTECRLRCIPAGTAYAQEILSHGGADVFDLTKKPAPPSRRAGSEAAAGTPPRGAPSPGASPGRPSPRTVGPAAPGAVGLSRELSGVSVESEDWLRTIPAPPQSPGTLPDPARGGGAPWLLVLLPTAVAVVAASAAVFFVWQLGQARADLDQLRASNSKLTELNSKLNNKLREAKAQSGSMTQGINIEPDAARSGTQTTDRPAGEASEQATGVGSTRESPSLEQATEAKQLEGVVRASQESSADDSLRPEITAPIDLEKKLVGWRKKEGTCPPIDLVNFGQKLKADQLGLSTPRSSVAAEVLKAKISTKKSQLWKLELLDKDAFELELASKDGRSRLQLKPCSSTSEERTLNINRLQCIPIALTMGDQSWDIVMHKTVNAKLAFDGDAINFDRPCKLFKDQDANECLARHVELLESPESEKLIEYFQFGEGSNWKTNPTLTRQQSHCVIENADFEFKSNSVHKIILEDEASRKRLEDIHSRLKNFEGESKAQGDAPDGFSKSLGSVDKGLKVRLKRIVQSDDSVWYKIEGVMIPLRSVYNSDNKHGPFEPFEPQLRTKLENEGVARTEISSLKNVYIKFLKTCCDELSKGVSEEMRGNKLRDCRNALHDLALLVVVETLRLPSEAFGEGGVRLSLRLASKPEVREGEFVLIDSLGE